MKGGLGAFLHRGRHLPFLHCWFWHIGHYSVRSRHRRSLRPHLEKWNGCQRRPTLSWGCVELREVFKPFEAGERRSSLCNLILQSFPFLPSSITRHDYLFISKN